MKLVSFSSRYLRLDEPLPFGLRDASGRLLLGAGMTIAGPSMLAELQAQELYAFDAESADWHRRLAAAVDEAIRKGASLGEVAAIRPEPAQPQEPAAPVVRSLPEQWQELTLQLDAALRDLQPGGDWRGRLLGVHVRARALYQRRPDASLYWMVYEAGHSTEKYSCHHALLTLLMGEQAAAHLGWPQAWIDSLGRAALTMNVAMQRLQDQLAASERHINADMRNEIRRHPQVGADLLRHAGLPDALCLQVVRLHHEPGTLEGALAALPPERQLALLLHRVDVFAAKISRRVRRAPMSPVRAAREACLGADGTPDEIGSALLKAVGMYPPGSFVELISGELGIVVARGRRANLPYVASLVGASGSPLGEPALRDTLDRRFAVKAAVAPDLVKVRPPHERLLAMR